jgi:uncharacterized phiE125 gp8 family phage protein
MGLIQIQPPSAEPLSLADAKNVLRLDGSDTSEDVSLAIWIQSAREYAQALTGRSFITQRWRLVLDGFAGGYGSSGSDWQRAVDLEFGPVQSVDAVTYTGLDRSVTTWASTEYIVDTAGPLGRLAPRFGKVWPIAIPEPGSVQIEYTAGYGGTSSAVPACVRQWMLARLRTSYDHRGEFIAERGIKIEPMAFVDRLLDPVRVMI